MKTLSHYAVLFLALSVSMFAQTFQPRSDTFVFDSRGLINSWDGSDPANPPYPYAMGSINLTTPGIVVPWELGYLNNGYLVPCDPIVYGPITWVIGDGTHSGDTYTKPGATTCPYFTGEYGSSGNSWNILDGFSVTVTYVRQFVRSCYRGRCHNYVNDVLQGGNGTLSQTEINP
jgi:hypothetical protein